MVRVRYTLSIALAAAAAFTISAGLSRDARACDKAQCPLNVSSELTGPAPQPLAASEEPAAAPMKLDRFRRRAASGKVYQAERTGSKKVASSKSTKRSIVAQRAKASQRSRVAAVQSKADDEAEKPVVAPSKSKRTPVAAAATPTGPVLASADSVELNAASDVKVVSPEEVNELDLAAGPAQAEPVVATVTPTPTPMEASKVVETTGRASSLDSIQRELASHATTAENPSAPDETWLRKMLLVLGGAFAAAAAAARLLMTA